MLLVRNQIHWAGHLTMIKDVRLPKQLFYDELLHGKHPRYIPRKCFKDSVKNNLRPISIDVEN